MLSGCTSWGDYVRNGFKVGPNYGRPAAPVAEQWIDASDPAVSSGPANDAAWWQAFHDPILDSLVQTAYQQNLPLRVAGLRVLEARAQRGIAVGGLFPQSQQAFGDYTRTGLSQNGVQAATPSKFFSKWDTGASLAWELDFWGRFRRAIEAADANLDASVEDYDDVLVLLLSDVAQQYIDLRTAEQRLEYAQKNVQIQRDSLNLADLKFKNGVTTKLDVTQGQSTLSQTEANIPPLEIARRQAANQLCILLGIPPRDLNDILNGRHTIPKASPQVAVGIPAELLRRRPDVRRAERQVAAQSAQIGFATADLYPHFSITGSIFLDATKFADLFDASSVAGSVGPSFRWDILNYGRLVNNIRVQDARFQQLVIQYQQTVLQANAEAENSIVGFLKSQQQVKYLAESTTAAEQSVGLVRAQYDAGHTDFNRVLTIQQTLTQQQDQLAVAEGLVAQNLVLLYKALGGGWQIRLAAPAVPPAVGMGQPGPGEPTPAPQAPLPPAGQP
jgi:NodT family efflux transporter outer membrane factor (OMF) lipoprotein